MDTMAALNFGVVIGLNIREKGVKEEYMILRETVWAGAAAGILMALIYSALAYIGAPMGWAVSQADNGARILTLVADSLYGRLGMALLGTDFPYRMPEYLCRASVLLQRIFCYFDPGARV